jgi:hypothetical protein
MTPSTPVAAMHAATSSQYRMLPLAKTGIFMASLTALILSQSAYPDPTTPEIPYNTTSQHRFKTRARAGYSHANRHVLQHATWGEHRRACLIIRVKCSHAHARNPCGCGMQP